MFSTSIKASRHPSRQCRKEKTTQPLPSLPTVSSRLVVVVIAATMIMRRPRRKRRTRKAITTRAAPAWLIVMTVGRKNGWKSCE
ncbi:hypothetical protein MtrunA17_Chr1g0201831 [Medicago truncatula]|uniref:Transmembrane protein n=1 Tax=Medicago truncatula TaxID=3880 RepID=A0A396K6Y4_MEDTR|nr:hypothetical protein MtrunA17_Chr1g0201831 [Medicago truncatula]